MSQFSSTAEPAHTTGPDILHPLETPLETGLIEMFDAFNIAFAIYDSDLRVRFWSGRAADVVPAAETVGKRLDELFVVDAAILERYHTALATGRGFTIAEHIPLDRRLPKSLAITAVPIGNELAVFYADNNATNEQEAARVRSELRFRKLSDSLSVALVMIDKDLRVTYWNRSAEELTGLAESEALGLSAGELFAAAPQEIKDVCVATFETREPFHFERIPYSLTRLNGYFSVRGFMVEGELALLIENKTDAVVAEEHVRASEERFRTLSQNMSLALVLIDENRKLTYWNRMSEITAGDALTPDSKGRDAYDVLPLLESTLNTLLARARAGQEVKQRVEPEREGVTGTYEVRAFAVGQEVAFLVEDVTVQVRQAAELDRTNQQLLDLYQNAPCGYLSVLADGSVDRMNRRMAEWLGYESGETFTGTRIDDILCADSGVVARRMVQEANFDSPVNNLEVSFMKKDGEKLTGLVNALPIIDSLENKKYWRWTVVDITELREAQRQIEDSRLFNQLFNELGEAVLISDKDGKIVRANDSASRILGIPLENLTSLTHDDDIWRVVLDDGTAVSISELPGVRALREKQSVSSRELGVMRPDGRLTWILESAAPLFDNQGEITGVIVTFPEVTATVKQRQALKELNDKLAVERDRANDANRLKSSFLANMSHEIRTPMTAILGFSDILATELAGKVSEQHYTFLRSINVSGKRLLNLINDILDLSKIEAGKLELQNEDIDLRHEIESSVTPLAFIAKQKQLEFHVHPSTERVTIRGDRQRFNQILTNIVSNAIKFTRQGSITIRTFVTNHRTAAIEIQDSGIGISEEFLPHLFEEFRQEHTGVTREFGGTGLGLAISNRLIGLMGGSIDVRSKQGEGTVFIVYFPLIENPAPLQPSSVMVPPSGVIQARPQSIPVDTASRRHVLVVEDNSETQRLLDVYLKQQYRVSQAMNAQEAFAQIQKEAPDCILMDVNLPGMDGLSITRKIRAGDECPKVPIIALTAFAMTGDRQRCIDAGCDDYLSKPATKREVLGMIEKVLG